MPNEKLLEYIRNERSVNISDQVLKQNLLNAGWEEDIVENTFIYLDNNSNNLDKNNLYPSEQKSKWKENFKGFAFIIVVGFMLSFLFDAALGMPIRLLLSIIGKNSEQRSYVSFKMEKEMFPLKPEFGTPLLGGGYTPLSPEELKEVQDYNHIQTVKKLEYRDQQARKPINIFYKLIDFFSAYITVLVVAILYLFLNKKDKNKTFDAVKAKIFEISLVDKISSWIYLCLTSIILIITIIFIVLIFSGKYKGMAGFGPLIVLSFSIPLLIIFSLVGLFFAKKNITNLQINNLSRPFYLKFLYIVSKYSLILIALLIPAAVIFYIVKL